MNKTGIIVAGLIAAAACGIGYHETQLAQLRQKALLAEMARNDQLAERLRHSSDQAEKLREQLSQLQSRQRKSSGSETEAAAATGSTDRDKILANLANGMIEFSSLGNVGQDTPRAALETFYWAITHGSPADIAKVIVLVGPAKDQADALYASLPADVRAQYASPEEVVALYTAKWAASKVPASGAMTISSEASGAPNNASINAQLPGGPQFYPIQFSASGWQMVVPPWVVTNAEKDLTGPPVGGDAKK